MKRFIGILAAIAVIAFALPSDARAQTAPTIISFDVQPADGKVFLNGIEYPNKEIAYQPLPIGRKFRTDAVVQWCRGDQCERQLVTVNWTPGQSQRVTVRGSGTAAGAIGAIGQIEGAKADPGGTNFGLQVDQLKPKAEESYQLGDREVNKIEASRAVAEGLPDDRQHLRLTLVGDKSFTAPILADLAKSDLKDRFVVQAYTPDAWQIKDRGFPGGNQIVVQSPQGKVLHRQTDYSDGFVGLEKAVKGAEAAYKPELDPDRRGEPTDVAAIVVGLAIAAFLLFR